MEVKLMDVLTINSSPQISLKGKKEVKISAVQVSACLSSKVLIEFA